MSQMLERPRRNRRFERADILSQFGETISFFEIPIPTQIPTPARRPVEAPRHDPAMDEDPERWDGMS